jgi:hypothetical protein
MPKLGPWKLVDEFGAAAATIMVNHYLDPGVTETTVKYETVRKMKLAVVNLYQASGENESSAVIGGKDGKKQLIMGVPIYLVWSSPSWNASLIWRDKVVQDYGLSKKAAVALQVRFEKEWEAARDNAGNRLEIAQLACFALLAYARALRGEEITKIELSGVRKYFGDGAIEPQHVTLSLIRRLKQVEGEHQHFLPVAAVTGSGLRIREWAGRLLKEKEMTGVISNFHVPEKGWKACSSRGFWRSLNWETGMDPAKHERESSGRHWSMGQVWSKEINAAWSDHGGPKRGDRRANHWRQQWLAKDRISRRKNATVLHETAVYLDLSRFETSIEVFLGHLRWDRGFF